MFSTATMFDTGCARISASAPKIARKTSAASAKRRSFFGTPASLCSRPSFPRFVRIGKWCADWWSPENSLKFTATRRCMCASGATPKGCIKRRAGEKYRNLRAFPHPTRCPGIRKSRFSRGVTAWRNARLLSSPICGYTESCRTSPVHPRRSEKDRDHSANGPGRMSLLRKVFQRLRNEDARRIDNDRTNSIRTGVSG